MRLLACELNMSVSLPLGDIMIEKPFTVVKGTHDTSGVATFTDILPEQYTHLSRVSDEVQALLGFPISGFMTRTFSKKGEVEISTVEEFLLRNFPDAELITDEGEVKDNDNLEEHSPKSHRGRASRKS